MRLKELLEKNILNGRRVTLQNPDKQLSVRQRLIEAPLS